MEGDVDGGILQLYFRRFKFPKTTERIKNYILTISEDVVRKMRSISGEPPLPGGVLVLVDRNSAYCVGRKNEMSWPDLRSRLVEAS